MYKLIYADDERKIRAALNSIIDWKGLNISKICECENGDQLVQKIIEEKPDIVLSDMRMPGINGTKLLEKIREVDKNVRVIVISGFEDFAYLKQAMVSGVDDYILKPIDINELNSALSATIEKINDNEKFIEHIEENQKNTLIDGIINDEIKIDAFKSLLDITQDDTLFIANVCSWNLNLSQSRVEQRIRKFIKGNPFGGILALKDTKENGNFICIIKNDDVSNIIFQMENLRVKIEKECETKTFIGVTKEGRTCDLLSSSFRESKNIVSSMFVDNPSTSCEIRSYVFQIDFPFETMRKVSHQGNIDNIISIINNFVASLGENSNEMCINDVKRFQDEIIYRIRYIHNLLNGNENCSIIDELENNLKNYIDLKLIVDIITEAVKNIHFNVPNKRTATYDVAKNICSYIDEHLFEKISLDDLSNKYYLNKEYLSRIFKQHLGVGVFDYIDEKRIYKSNEMLKAGIPISKIVDTIGFYDESHFYKKYKKVMGFNPTQYKG